MKARHLSRIAFPLATAIAALLAAPSLHAGQIWDGGGADNNWNTAANWDSDALPTFTNAITFTGNLRNGTVNDLAAASIIGGINLANDGTTGKTNAFTLSGNSITLGGDITTTATTPVITDTISLGMILDGNRTITTNTNHNLIVGAPLTETGGVRDLVKNGAGTLRFDGINTYSGTTTINAGTVEVRAGTAGGSAVWGIGPITLSQGATIFLNPATQAIQNTPGFSVAGLITLSGGAGTANMRFSGNDNKFALSGGVTGQAGVAQTFALTQGASITGGDRQDILFSGAIADGSGGTLGVSVDFAGTSGTAQNAFVNLRGQNTFTGNLTVTNSKGMNGGNTYPGAWLTIGGERYVGFTAPTTTTVGTGFLGAGADYSGNISISNGTGLTTLSFLTSANQILRGVISGTGALNQQGTGTLSLTNANTFTGGTSITAGILQLATGGSLSDTGAITVNGGTFDIQTVSDTVGAVTLTSGTITGTSGVLNASSYSVRSGTASAILGGSGALTKTTTGAVTLSGANTYSGTTTVSAGTLTLDYSTPTQDNSKLSDFAALILGGGTVALSGGSHTEVVASTTLQAGTVSSITGSSINSILQLGTVTVNTGASLNLSAAGIATTNNLNNSLGILGPWATIGGTAWAVNSTNSSNGLITEASFTDVTRLSSGAKTITSGPGHIRIIEGTGTVGDVTMAAAGTTSIDTLVNTAITAGTVAVGTGNTLSTGAILQATGAGALTIGTFGATAGTLTALSAGGDLGVVSNSSSAFTINPLIANNTSASTLTKEGTGIVTLTGANTYSGGTTVAAGVLAVGLNANASPVGGDNITPDGTSTSLGSGAVNVAAGAAMHINTAGLNIANNITLNGLSYGTNSGGPTATNSGPWNGALMGVSKTGVVSNTFSGTITLNATSNVSTNWNDKTMIITGKVTGAGGLTFDNSAPANRRGGLFRLDNNTNDYAGDTTINAGNGLSVQPTLILGASNVIPDGAGKGNLSVLGNLNLNSFNETVNGLSGSGPISNGVALTTSTLIVGNNNATGLTYSGVIQNGSGTVALAKTGTGTQTLSGVSTFTGGTTVSQGTLALAAGGGGPGIIRGTLDINTGAIVTPLFSGTGWGLGFQGGTSVNTININGGQLLFTGTAGNGGTAASNINMTGGTIGGSGGNTFDWYFGNTTNPSLNTLGSASSATVSANLNLRLNGNGNALTFNVANGAAANDLFVSGNIIASNSGDGFGRIVKTGAGVMVVTGTNTYGGGTTISNGTLEVRNSSGLGSGSVSVSAGAKLMSNGNNLTFANNITLNGTSTNGALYCFQPGAGVTNNYTGTITLNATSNVSTWWNDKTLHLSGKITGPGGLSFEFQPGSVGGRYLISGATNDYAGPTTVTGDTLVRFGFTGQSMLYLGATNAIPVTSALTLNNADLYLNGQSQTLPSISGSGSFSVQNGSTTAASLTLGAGDTTSTFSGSIKDNGIIVTNTASTSPTAPVTIGKVSLTKIGTGTLTLGGINTYTGNTTVNDGTLELADNAQLKFVLGAISGSNNSISGSGTVSLEGDFVIDTSSADALASGTWILENVLSLTGPYGSNFTVVGFDNAGGNLWTKSNGATTYTFDETTGTLTLAAGSTYASWIAGFYPGETNPLIIGVTADPDNDGIPNGAEMVLGGNPATGMDTVLLPTIELVTDPPSLPAGNYLLFTYRRTAISETALVAAACETDTDLVAPWTPAINAVSGVVIQEDLNFSFTPAAPADTDRVRVYVPRGANTKLFGRLNVAVP